jgi:hypothetical protein
MVSLREMVVVEKPGMFPEPEDTLFSCTRLLAAQAGATCIPGVKLVIDRFPSRYDAVT